MIYNQLLTDLAVHNSVEILSLISAVLNDQLVRSLCGVKTLKILKFSGTSCLDGNQCKKIACELSNLSEIQIIYCEGGITFNMIKEFVVHSPNLMRIVYIRRVNARPLIGEMFLSYVAARQRAKAKETLLIFLKADDLVVIRNGFRRNGMSKLLIEHANVVNLLPLKKLYDFRW